MLAAYSIILAHCGEVHLCSPGLCWFFCLLLMVYPSNIKTPNTAVCSDRVGVVVVVTL
ncbi:hypothetical protein BV20DRAFT_1058301 [Pilatotrama ljubarskyi]|nr:hypothetical protein BV20DRAFT_1058301 [Pilatotrama ljubarskyi]